MSDAPPPTTKAAPSELTPEGLLPTGALFEAAFKRFGARMPYYLLYAAIAGLVPLAGAVVVRAGSLDGAAAFAVLGFAYALGLCLLMGRLAALMTDTPNARWPSIVGVSLVCAAVVAVLVGVLPPAVAAIAWVIAPIPIAAGSGDADGLAGLTHGGALALRYFPRCMAVEAGLILIAVALWFGFGIAITQFVSADAMQLPRAIVSSLFLWPIAALVLRNLYGDLTGRRVVAGPVYTHPEKRRR